MDDIISKSDVIRGIVSRHKHNLSLPQAVIFCLLISALFGLAGRVDAAYVDLFSYSDFGYDNLSPVGLAGRGPVSNSMITLDVYEGKGLKVGERIDVIRYYYIDSAFYYYEDKRQYNLLGAMAYLIENMRYRGVYSWGMAGRRGRMDSNGEAAALWYGSGGMNRILYGPILPLIGIDPFVFDMRGIAAAYGVDPYHICSSFPYAGNYIDKWQYYLLDDAQYYYLDRWQYKLLNARTYILGHPLYPYWHHFNLAQRYGSVWLPEDDLCRDIGEYRITQSAGSGVSGNVVPEPATVGIFALGALLVLRLSSNRSGIKG